MSYVIVSDVIIWAVGDTPETAWQEFDECMGETATHEGFEVHPATPALVYLVARRGEAGISWAYRQDGTACLESEI